MRKKLVADTLIAYSAGLMDGEGCIRWNKSPSVEVSNKHIGVLYKQQETWGGSVRCKGQNVFVWTLYGQNALKYLRDVMTFSVIKYPQILTLFCVVKATTKTERARHINTLKRMKHEYSN